MANTSTPMGFKPVRHISGAPYNGGGTVFSTASGDGTAIYIGDLVKLAGTGQTVNGVQYADVAAAATGDVFVGAVVAVLPDTRDSLIYRAASTVRRVLVATNPHLLFEAQEGPSGTAFTANDISLNVNLTAGTAGSTTTGQSGMQLDNTTEATTNTLDLQMVEFVNRPDNAIGNAAKWLVRINRHQFANQVAGA